MTTSVEPFLLCSKCPHVSPLLPFFCYAYSMSMKTICDTMPVLCEINSLVVLMHNILPFERQLYDWDCTVVYCVGYCVLCTVLNCQTPLASHAQRISFSSYSHLPQT